MELTKDDSPGKYKITAYEEGCVYVNGQPYYNSILIMPEDFNFHWGLKSIDKLSKEDIQMILKYSPHIVLLGSGSKLSFPSKTLLEPLHEQGIGIEIMDTAAACRTYTVLMSEDRRVLAGLII